MRRDLVLLAVLFAAGCSGPAPRAEGVEAAWPGRLYWIDLQGDLHEAALDGSGAMCVVRGAKIIGGFATTLEDGRAVLVARGVGKLTDEVVLAAKAPLSKEDLQRGLPAIDAPGNFVRVEYRYDEMAPNKDCLPGPLKEIRVQGYESGAWNVPAKEGCREDPRVVGAATAGVAWVLADRKLFLWDYRTGNVATLLDASDATVWPLGPAKNYPEMRTRSKRWRLKSPADWRR